MPNESNRRLEDRAPLTLLVDYPDRDDLVSDFTENLSMGGTFVRTERELTIGSQIRLLLSCPGLIEPIALRGLVRWTRPALETADAGAGIQFTEYDEEVRRRLRHVIDGIASNNPDVIGQEVNLLVVEDNKHIVDFIRDGLTLGRNTLGESVAFQFTIARDGRSAVELLKSQSFDAAIIDVYLPELDGIAVIEKARASQSTQFLPIVAISAGGRDAADRALAAGADRFLSKPIRLKEVLDALRSIIAPAPE